MKYIFKVNNVDSAMGISDPVFFTDYSDAIYYVLETQFKDNPEYDNMTTDELNARAYHKIRGYDLHESFDSAILGD